MRRTGGANCPMRKRLCALCFASIVFLAAWRCPLGSPLEGTIPEDVRSFVSDFSLNPSQTNLDLEFLTASPHPFGSPRQLDVANFLERRITESGGRVEVQEFKADIPNVAALSMPASLTRTVSGRNIFAWPKRFDSGPDSGKSCVVLLASHYDSKAVDGISYVGANDSGSSSVALLQLLQHVQNRPLPKQLECSIGFVWFDGEEATLPGWSDGETVFPVKIKDHTYGSRHAASQSMPKKLAALILLDMIGSPDLRLTRDSRSTPALLKLMEAAIAALGYPPSLLSEFSVPVEDDHIPFLERGIPALNIIDFNDLSVWHRTGDDSLRINPNSIEKASRIGIMIALTAALDPQGIR